MRKYLPLLSMLALGSAPGCAPGDELPTRAAAAALSPYVLPTSIAPFTFCAGPRWEQGCDAIFLLPEEWRLTGPGTYDCVSWCAGTHPRRVSLPNFAGWVQARANENDWRRAYRLSLPWVKDTAAAICGPSISGCAFTLRWPAADGGEMYLELSFLNDVDTAPASDGQVTRFTLQHRVPAGFFIRHEELYSLATTTYAATAARQAGYSSVWDLNAAVAPANPALGSRYLVRF